jgi:hypothetical protein
MSNYLFLDVDGVLNNYYSEGEYFVPYNMNCLKQLCDFIDFKIVLSSDWRRSPKNKARVRSELKHIGLELYSYTPLYTTGGDRKDEIKEWLKEDDDFSGLILDDMSADECDPKLPNLLFYRTDYKLGLTEQDVDSILEKLNGLPPRS